MRPDTWCCLSVQKVDANVCPRKSRLQINSCYQHQYYLNYNLIPFLILLYPWRFIIFFKEKLFHFFFATLELKDECTLLSLVEIRQRPSQRQCPAYRTTKANKQITGIMRINLISKVRSHPQAASSINRAARVELKYNCRKVSVRTVCDNWF